MTDEKKKELKQEDLENISGGIGVNKDNKDSLIGSAIK